MKGLVVLAVFISACTAEPATTTSAIAPTTTTAGVLTEIERRRAGRFDVIVRDGRVISCALTENDWNARCSQALTNTPVGELFSYVTRGSSDYTTVTFDEDWHFPTFVGYDDPSTIDEEFEAKVISFELLD